MAWVLWRLPIYSATAAPNVASPLVGDEECGFAAHKGRRYSYHGLTPVAMDLCRSAAWTERVRRPGLYSVVRSADSASGRVTHRRHRNVGNDKV